MAVVVLPAPARRVARGIVDLVHALRPRAFVLPRGYRPSRPGVGTFVGQQRVGLVTPFLAPVARNDRLADTAVFHLHAHHQDVLQGYEIFALLGYEDVFGAPALIGRVRLQRRIESQHFQEIETDAIRTGHRQYCATIALHRAQTWLTQPPPGFAGHVIENDRGAARAGAARFRSVLTQRPGESEPACDGAARFAGFVGLCGGGKQGEEKQE